MLGLSIQNASISNASDSFLGTIGPAGGIIFIAPDTPGNVTGSYFEAAPFNIANNQRWCEDWYVSLGVRSESIGSGYTNTELIAAHCSTGAAKLAKSYSFAGYSNWFLPSKNEMLELMRFVDLLQDTSVLALWTSTEQTTSDLSYSEFAWCVYPRNKLIECIGPKYGENRAVRAVHLVSVSEMILFKNAAAKADADKAAAELKAKQEADAKVAAELKAKQEADAKVAADKAAAELKVKQEADAKVAAELKAKQEADAKAAADKAASEAAAKIAADKIIADANAQAAAILAAAQAKPAANKKSTITCVKGKLTKKVTSVKPVCPAGYKKK